MSWRSYELSGDKLEKFTALMVLDDVPVFVRPGGDSIEIQATGRQHEVLNAFFQMIDPSALRTGRFFTPEHRRPHGSVSAAAGCGGCEQVAAGSTGCCGDCPGCRKLNEAKSVQRKVMEARDLARRELARVRVELGGKAAELREVAREKARQIRQRVRQQIRGLRATAESQEEMLETLQEQVGTMRDQGESLRERADEIRERAEELRERASEEAIGEETHTAFERQIQTLVEGAAGLDGKAASMDELAAMLEGKTGAVEEQIHALEEYAEQLVERVSAIDDAQQLIEDGVEGNVELAARMAAASGSAPCGLGMAKTPTYVAEEPAAPLVVEGSIHVAAPHVVAEAPELTTTVDPIEPDDVEPEGVSGNPANGDTQVTAESDKVRVAQDVAKALEASLAAVHAALTTEPEKPSDPK